MEEKEGGKALDSHTYYRHGSRPMCFVSTTLPASQLSQLFRTSPSLFNTMPCAELHLYKVKTLVFLHKFLFVSRVSSSSPLSYLSLMLTIFTSIVIYTAYLLIDYLLCATNK
jgi:hypothetical protein